MRSEQEMVDLILTAAKSDGRVRAVYLNGSRANPNVKKDKFRDYDIVFVVTETQSFISDKSWLNGFGELAMMQEPDNPEMGWGENNDAAEKYTFLMLFQDGNRIDLSIKVPDCAVEEYLTDTQSVGLLDKDGILPPRGAASEDGYLVKPPRKQNFAGCCNEFWWCLNNVAKGLVRGQTPYALAMYYRTVHVELEKMTAWYIGAQHGFKVSTGKWGKYFQKYLSSELYGRFEKTYSDAKDDNLWNAIFSACSLFRMLARTVANFCGFVYNEQEDENMSAYLKSMRRERPT